jgi:hypothetical protein
LKDFFAVMAIGATLIKNNRRCPMKVRIERLGEGLHPSEEMIAIATSDGREEMAVDKAHLQGDELDIGWPVGTNGDLYLIELPNETFRGTWRVWVPRDSLIREEAVA